MSILCCVDSENDGGQAAIVKKLLAAANTISVAVFVSKATSNEIKDLLIQNPDKLKPFWCENGHKNAMDFCIATYLGKMVAEHPKDEFRIYSNDSGYDAIVSFWTSQGIRISRVQSGKPENNKKLHQLPAELQERIMKASVQSGISINNIIESCGHANVDYKSNLAKRGYSSKQIKTLTKTFSSTQRKKLRAKMATTNI